MNYEIETYKGHDITYNDSSDKFECGIELNGEVKNSKRSSLNDVKKDIDQFIKKNLNFKPFKFIEVSRYGSESFSVMYCISIRTDGSFVVSSSPDGSYKSYYSEKDMQRARVFDQNVMDQIEVILDEKKAIQNKIDKAYKDLFQSLVPFDASKYII